MARGMLGRHSRIDRSCGTNWMELGKVMSKIVHSEQCPHPPHSEKFQDEF